MHDFMIVRFLNPRHLHVPGWATTLMVYVKIVGYFFHRLDELLALLAFIGLFIILFVKYLIFSVLMLKPTRYVINEYYFLQYRGKYNLFWFRAYIL
jgi:hypothetical protein